MHPFGIVPHKPVDEFSIEYYGCGQILHVVIGKFFMYLALCTVSWFQKNGGTKKFFE